MWRTAKTLLIIACVVFFLFCFSQIGFSLFGVFIWLVQSVWYLCTGWLYCLATGRSLLQSETETIVAILISSVVLTAIAFAASRRFYRRSDSESIPARRQRLRWVSAITALLIFFFVTGIAAERIKHQAAWMFSEPITARRGGVREASERSMSTNNLKQIGLAFENHHDQLGSFPTAATLDRHGRLMHGWQTSLLPFIEQSHLYSTIDLSQPWHHQSNQNAFTTDIKVFRAPPVKEGKADRGYAITTYAGNLAFFQGERPITFIELVVGRGTSNTIIVGETGGNYRAWGQPFNVRDPKLGLNKSPEGFGSPRKNGSTLFAMADGSVRNFSDSTDPDFLRLLAEPE